MVLPIYRVLIVDDELSAYEFAADLLNAASDGQFEVDWEPKYHAAFDKICAHAYDVYLLDYRLGDLNGMDLLRSVREAGAEAPIIVLTGHGDYAVDLEALESGATEFLEKDRLRPKLLARTIRYAVKHQRDQAELRTLYKQLSELEQLKTDMIRLAAHDLRTPITVMFNYTGFLKEDLTDERHTDYLTEIEKAARRMQRIISDILSLERIDEMASPETFQPIDLCEVIAKSYETAASPKTHAASYQRPDAPVYVLGDPAQLGEAATNLIGNAFKYTAAGGTVDVSLTTTGGQAHFHVRDSGYGIPEKMQGRLFQPFYRAKTQETKLIEGTGLGLHLVKKIVERHSGNLIFESEYGTGSTFGFSLPLTQG